MIDERMFPVIGGECAHGTNGMVRRPYGSIPWSIAEVVYVAYAKRFGSDQSLEEIASRGGFGWSEIVMLLSGQKGEVPVYTGKQGKQ